MGYIYTRVDGDLIKGGMLTLELPTSHEGITIYPISRFVPYSNFTNVFVACPWELDPCDYYEDYYGDSENESYYGAI